MSRVGPLLALQQLAGDARESRSGQTRAIRMTLGDWHGSCGRSAVLNVIDRRVRFRLRDVCIPDVDELLATLYGEQVVEGDRKSTRLNSSHRCISYAVFCL